MRHPTHTRRFTPRYRAQRIALNVLVTAVLVLLSYYFVAPVVWLALASTKTQSDIFTTPPLWFGATFRLWDNVRHVLTSSNDQALIWARNSVEYTVPSVVLTVLTSAAAGYGLAKYRFRGRVALLFVVMISLLMPGTALAIPVYLEGSTLGLVNTPFGVILPSAASAFGVWLCYNFFNFQFNTEIMHAARIDGANEYQTFWLIALPSARAVLATLTMLSFVGNWNNFFLPFLMESRDDLMPLPVGLTSLAQETGLGSAASTQAGSTVVMTDVIALALLVALPIVVVFIVVRRHWAAGLLSGSLQGQ